MKIPCKECISYAMCINRVEIICDKLHAYALLHKAKKEKEVLSFPIEIKDIEELPNLKSIKRESKK